MGIFDVLKQTNLNVISEVGQRGVRVVLKEKSGKSLPLPLSHKKNLEFSKWQPDIAHILYNFETAIRQIGNIAVDTSEGQLGFTPEELAEKNCGYENGGIFLSYKLISAIRFGDAEEITGISESDLRSIGVPQYENLRISLDSEGLYKDSDFKFKLHIQDKNDSPIIVKEILGHFIRDNSGELHFVNPLVIGLIRSIDSHKKLRNTIKYKRDQDLRIKDFSEVRELAMQVSVNLDQFIRSEDVVYLDRLPYELGRDINGELVASPRMPIDHRNHDRAFEKVINSTDDLSETSYLNLKNNLGNRETTKRVFLSDSSKDDIKKIKNFNRALRIEKETWAESPEDHFGHLPREYIGGSFSKRVSGFITGKVQSNRADLSNGREWGQGFEDESTMLRAVDNFTVKINYKPLPEEYAAIKRLVPELKHEEVEHESKNRRESGASLTPLPREEAPTIFVPELNGKYNRSELERFLKQVENSYQISIEDENVPAAKEKIAEAERTNNYTVEWEESSDSELKHIPLASLKRALPREEVTQKERERVYLAIEGEVGRIGKPPAWHWKSINTEDFASAPKFKSHIKLWPHQRTGYAWLRWIYEHQLHGNNPQHRGALMADDMGLGKTIQAIALISYIRSLKVADSKPILIIAPLGLIRTSWLEDGFASFLEPDALGMKKNPQSFDMILNFSDCPHKPDLKLSKEEAEQVNAEMRKQGKSINECSFSSKIEEELDKVKEWCSDKIIITSYETARNRGIALASVDFSLIILDEAQKIKNTGSLQSNSVKALKGDMYIAMTGTPIENSLMDLWGIMDFVLPNHLGDQTHFKKTFVAEVKRSPVGSEQRIEARKKLESALEPVWLRRTKKEIYKNSTELPDIIHHDSITDSNGNISNEHEAEMSEKQEYIYGQFAKHYGGKSGGGLSALRAMLDTCSAPWEKTNTKVIWKNKDELFCLCPKLEVLISILEKIRSNSDQEGQKVILFANIRSIQRDLAYFIFDWSCNTGGEPVEVEVYNGKVPDKKRGEILSRFKSAPGFAVIIISPKAGGVGLNLTEANHVIHYTREWNPALERQATDRAYRLKQKRIVHVYYPTAVWRNPSKLSAEQHLAALLREKRDVMDDFTISSAESNLDKDLKENLHSESSEDFQISPDELQFIDHRKFEAYIACLFELARNMETYVIGKSRDRGADVLCLGGDERLLIQVKHTKSKNEVGTKAIQEIRGAKSVYEHTIKKTFSLVAATNYKFSIDAVNLASWGDGVQLVEFGTILEMSRGVKISNSDLQKKLNSEPSFDIP